MSFLCFSLGYSQSKKVEIKTYKNNNIILNYPKTWKAYPKNGNVALQPIDIKPKKYNRLNFSHGPNFVYVNFTESSDNYKNNTDKELLQAHASKVSGHEMSKDFKIVKLFNDPKFEYRIDYNVKFDFTDKNYKQTEYVFKLKNKIHYCYYIMREDLFDKYYDEAMSIINSIEKR